MTSPLVRRPSLAKKLFPVVALIGCLGVGFGVALGVRVLFLAPKPADEAAHEEHPPEEPVERPSHQRLSLAVKSGNYTAGLKIARGLLHDADHAHPDPKVQYALALCLEGQGRWADAIEAYLALGPEEAPAGVRAVAACGEVRCHLAEGNVAEATVALARAEGVSGVPGLTTELAYLRGRLAWQQMPRMKPGPFAPDKPIGDEPKLAPAAYADWLPLPEASVAPPHKVGGVPADAHLVGHVGEPKASRGEGPPSATDPTTAALSTFSSVLAVDPPHPDEPAVRLAVANLKFLAGDLTDAAREYKRVRDGHPPEPVQVAATYNLGLIRHRAGEWAVARQLFTDAADLGAHTPAAAVAWWWVGRTELDVGNAAACRQAWDRADQTSDREMTSAVLLGRVFLLLLDGEVARAEKMFHGQRVANYDPMPAVAEAFHCFFRLTGHPTRLKRDELIASVRHADLGQPFGPAGRLLFAGWLGLAGESNEMLAAYDAAADTTRGHWAVRIALASGEHLYAAGDPAAARGRFVAVAVADAGELGDRARVRLAEIALLKGDAAECVRLCRQVLKRDHEDREVVLRLLGRGYERLNRPRAAAECFAGRLPPQ